MLRWRWAKKTFNLNDVGSGINQVDHPCDKSELCVHARSSSTARRAECLSSSHQLSQQTLPSRTFSCPVAARFFVSHLRMCVCVCGPFSPAAPGRNRTPTLAPKMLTRHMTAHRPNFQLTNSPTRTAFVGMHWVWKKGRRFIYIITHCRQWRWGQSHWIIYDTLTPSVHYLIL